jgi:hypothetical protein
MDGMPRKSKRVWRLIGLALLVCGAVLLLSLAQLAFAQAFYPYHQAEGRLALYTDRPFAPDDARRLLDDVETRLRRSPLDDGRRHSIFIANTAWRRQLGFLTAGGAAGINWEPVTGNVYLRPSDIAANRLYRASGRPGQPPRTLAYYAAHEISHSFTARHLGARHLWNRRLPQWVREGYADYVGLGSSLDIDDLYGRSKRGDPDMSFSRSHTYGQFALLVAYFLQQEGWSVDQLLNSRLSLEQAGARMAHGMDPHPTASR